MRKQKHRLGHRQCRHLPHKLHGRQLPWRCGDTGERLRQDVLNRVRRPRRQVLVSTENRYMASPCCGTWPRLRLVLLAARGDALSCRRRRSCNIPAAHALALLCFFLTLSHYTTSPLAATTSTLALMAAGHPRRTCLTLCAPPATLGRLTLLPSARSTCLALEQQTPSRALAQTPAPARRARTQVSLVESQEEGLECPRLDLW